MSKKSAIGEYAYYVHYHASNFAKQQGLPSENYLSNYIVSKVQQETSKYRSKISINQKKDFANLISALMGRQVPSTEFTASQMQQLRQGIVDSLGHGFKSSDIVDWATGRVFGARKISDSSKKYFGAKRYLTESQIQTLIDQSNEINSNIASNKQKIMAGGGTDAKLLTKLEKLLEGYQGALQSLLTNFSADAKEYKFAKKPTQRTNVGNEFSKKINEINSLANQLGLLNGVLTAAQGELFEKAIESAGDLMAGLSVQAICNSFKESGVVVNGSNNRRSGDKKANLLWLQNGIPAETWAKTLMKDESYTKVRSGHDSQRFTVSKRGSQLKTDIVVEFSSKNPITGVEEKMPTNISAKSGDIFSQRGIGLVSGTDLWYLIQDLDRKDFLRPYLNIMAEHSYFYDFSFAKDKNSDFIKREAKAIEDIRGLRNSGVIATKIIFIWKALTGHTFGRYFSTAQLLVLNDTKSKKIYVVEIDDIIKLVCKSSFLLSGGLSQYFNFHDFDFNNLYFSNRCDETLHDRMAKLLNSIHKYKVSVSMNGNIINDINSKSTVIV